MNHTQRFLAVALSALSLTAGATAISDAQSALQAKDPAKAVRILEQAAKGGDVAAKGMLANYLRSLPAPHQDIPRACALALEAGNAGNAMGAVIRAECLNAGVVKIEQPWVQARDLAKKVIGSDPAAGGLVQYLAYTMDPRLNYVVNGQGDKKQYDVLAARPMSARAEQIDAITGLSTAMGSGLTSSYMAALNYLLQNAAPNNMKRAQNTAMLLQASGNKIPDGLVNNLQMVVAALKAGTTHTSPAVFAEAIRSTFSLTAIDIRNKKKGSCDPADLQIKRLEAGPVKSPVYLPIKVGPLVDTFLVSGTWTETWTLSGCGGETPVKIEFTADGGGGAKFKVL